MDAERAADVRGFIRWRPAFAVLSVIGLALVVVAHPGPLPGELGYIGWLQDLDEPVPTLARFVWTTTGSEAALVVAAVPAGLLIGRRDRRGVIVVAIAAVSILVAQPAVKAVVDRPRPSPEQVTVRAQTESMSFPSGHSMSTTTVWGAAAGAAWACRRRWVAVATAVPIVLTFFASGVQGVHWPTDAIAGTILGATAASQIVPRLPFV
ncbi:MAG TPA: phosphatase PAP2 family protein [Ilumatobacteraceae bacterium]|nr:phosphatase PAP2 family protein [Ilumatobacteraceae bacterium]